MKPGYATLLFAAAVAMTTLISFPKTDLGAARAASGDCASGETGISLPPGFCATIFADNLGHARHLGVASDGTVYVNSWSGRYYRNAPPLPGGFLIALRDTDGDGRADAWHGSPNAQLAAATAPAITAPTADVTPETAPTSRPAGFTAAQVALGRRIYLGEIRNGTCSGCHGSDGRGSSAGPSLTGPTWIWADGSVESLARVIAKGVPEPGPSGGIMLPGGGVDLTKEEVQSVAAYVWTLGRGGQ
jgi:mono/diheme cytochrome c family protein